MNTRRRRIFLAHNSCLNSSYDLNVLRVGLEKGGYLIVDQPELADEIIFSGCSVRSIWVDDAIRQINQIHARAPDARVTVTGCISNVSASTVQSQVVDQSVVFQSQSDILRAHTGRDFASVDREVSQDTTYNFESDPNNGLHQMRQRVGSEKANVAAELEKIDREFGTELARLYRRTTKGFVFYHEEEPAELITVSRSCLYRCSFCSIPRGRGHFTSVPLDDIVLKAKTALARGIKRVILVGDEVGNYGADGSGPRLPDLLNALVALDASIRLSIRYIEPKPFMRHADLLRRLCDSGNIELLYISLQSGSQRVLKLMNRNSDIHAVASMYATFRKTTDVVFYCNWMVGFPGETEQDFEDTVRLAEQLDLQINVAIPFSARPDTPAEQLADQIDEQVKAERVLLLTTAIAAMKAATFDWHLRFLDDSRRLSLVESIKSAEMQQYREPPLEERRIAFHNRTMGKGR